MLPLPMQDSLPAGWLAFTGRELNPLGRDERFPSCYISFPFPGFILTLTVFDPKVGDPWLLPVVAQSLTDAQARAIISPWYSLFMMRPRRRQAGPEAGIKC